MSDTPSPAASVLLVDDEQAMRSAMLQWLQLADLDVQAFPAATAALEHADSGFSGIIISDVKMPGLSGMELLEEVQRRDPDLPVVLVTGHGDVPMAMEAIRKGAYDFIEKPFEPERFLEVVNRAVEKRLLVLQNRQLRRDLGASDGLDAHLIGRTTPMRMLKAEIQNLAPTPASVLISGETGTGKEVVAQCLHEFGGRPDAPFIAVNCAAIPESMAESELFGHEAGAFTGARQRRIGHLEEANGGTLFLDEIASMPLPLQAKLLRAIESRQVTRLGGSRPVPVEFRLISAANRDLMADVREGLFRDDLFYRINTVELSLPPLRDRREDLPLLLQAFLRQAAETYDRPLPQITAAAHTLLTSHDWPGNVRELRNMAERLVLSTGPVEERLSRLLGAATPLSDEERGALSLNQQVQHFERHLIKDALKRHDGNVKAVMEELNIPRRTLNEKMQKYGVLRKDDV